MRVPAKHYLSLRALGAPAVVVSLALQGVFRGFKDTKTPVLCLGKYICVLSSCGKFRYNLISRPLLEHLSNLCHRLFLLLMQVLVIYWPSFCFPFLCILSDWV